MNQKKLKTALRSKLRTIGKKPFLKQLAGYYGHPSIEQLAQVKDSTLIKSLVHFAYGGLVANNMKKANPKMLAALQKLVGLPEKEEKTDDSGYDSEEIESLVYGLTDDEKEHKEKKKKKKKKKKTSPRRTQTQVGSVQQLTPAQRLALRLDSPEKASTTTLRQYFDIVDPEGDYADLSRADLQNAVTRIQQGQNAADLQAIAETISGGPKIKPWVLRAVQDRITQTTEQLRELKDTAKTVKKRLDKLAKTADLDPASRQQYLQCVEDYAKFQHQGRQEAGKLPAVDASPKKSRSLAKDLAAAALVTGAAVGAKKLYDIHQRKKFKDPANLVKMVEQWRAALPDEEKQKVADIKITSNKELSKFIDDNDFIFEKTPPGLLARFKTKINALKYLIPYLQNPNAAKLQQYFTQHPTEQLEQTVKFLLCLVPQSAMKLAFSPKGWSLLQNQVRRIRTNHLEDPKSRNVLLVSELARWVKNAPVPIQTYLGGENKLNCGDAKKAEAVPLPVTNNRKTMNWLTDFPVPSYVAIPRKFSADVASIFPLLEQIAKKLRDKTPGVFSSAINLILGSNINKKLGAFMV